MAKSKEIVWVKILNSKGVESFKITSDPLRAEYKIWGMDDGKYKLLGKGKDPGKLEEKYANYE